jgi:hypothetical protein
MDAMVLTAHVEKWNVTRVLVDNGSQAEILFLYFRADGTQQEAVERSIEATL